MVEITYNKKNIIILFILMSIILFFIYKGFIADSNHYLKEYKNYLISINASRYYFDKINKNKNNNDKKKKLDNENELKLLILKIRNYLNNSINMNERILKNLNYTNHYNTRRIKYLLNETIEYLNHRKKNDAELLNIIDKNIT